VSGYPILLEGKRIDALVVGGGAVGYRKAMALLDCGARVRVVAPEVLPALVERAAACPRLAIVRRRYAARDLAGATLVIVATNNRDVNARVRADANRSRRLVNVADAPDDGDFVTVAAHHDEPLVIAVSTGRLPSAAARIRDAIATRFDARFRVAILALASLRERLLATGDSARWAAAEDDLLSDQFCARVEDGTFAARYGRWESAALDPAGTCG